jgi:prevent-host-death family protein
MRVATSQARKALGALLDRVEQGEEVIITRHGKPVGRLVPCAAVVDRDAVLAALARIRARVRRLALPPISWEALKADRDLGRP